MRLDRRAAAGLGEWEHNAYTVALGISGMFQAYFPLEFAATCADRPVTMPEIYQVAVGFLGLVDERMLPLDGDLLALHDVILPDDPIAWLNSAPAVSEPFAFGVLGENRWLFVEPRPQFYGLGVQSLWYDHDDDMTMASWDALTLAIWTMFQHTAWRVSELDELLTQVPGYLVKPFAQHLTPLPELTHDQIGDLLDCLELGQPHGSELIAYAFGRTTNELANYTTMEVYDIWEGAIDFAWSGVYGLAREADQARDLCVAYAALDEALQNDPHTELRRLAQALHRAEQQRRRPIRPPRSATRLIDLIGAEHAIEITAPTTYP